MVKESFVIDDGLRRHLTAFEQLLGVPLSATDVARVFKDAEEDQVLQKSYQLYQSASLSVIGLVDEYEPETIWIQVEGTNRQEQVWSAYIADARLLKPHGSL